MIMNHKQRDHVRNFLFRLMHLDQMISAAEEQSGTIRLFKQEREAVEWVLEDVLKIELPDELTRDFVKSWGKTQSKGDQQ
jgi:hypothetical protein